MAYILKSGHKIVKLTAKEENIRKQLGKQRPECLRLDPDGWFFFATFRKYANQYHDFEVIIVSNNYNCLKCNFLLILYNIPVKNFEREMVGYLREMATLSRESAVILVII